MFAGASLQSFYGAWGLYYGKAETASALHKKAWFSLPARVFERSVMIEAIEFGVIFALAFALGMMISKKFFKKK